jgi:hypothetical protein
MAQQIAPLHAKHLSHHNSIGDLIPTDRPKTDNEKRDPGWGPVFNRCVSNVESGCGAGWPRSHLCRIDPSELRGS